MFLLNAFSLNMVAIPATISVEKVELDAVRALAPTLESGVGHADTAAVFGQQLGAPVPANRVTVSLKAGESAIVGQYRGPRLPEGATTLPDGATIEWLRVTVN